MMQEEGETSQKDDLEPQREGRGFCSGVGGDLGSSQDLL